MFAYFQEIEGADVVGEEAVENPMQPQVNTKVFFCCWDLTQHAVYCTRHNQIENEN